MGIATAALDKYLQRSSVRELAFVGTGRQGAVTAGGILTAALGAAGKHLYQAVYVRGERTNSPVVVGIRVADHAPVASCQIYAPTELLVLDELLYEGALVVDAGKAVFNQFRQGTLMLCTDKAPHEVTFPYDFEGTIATVDANRICVDVLKRDPPPFGTTALGLYVAATRAVAIEEILQAIRDRFPGPLGDLNAEAALRAYEATRVQPAKITGTKTRDVTPYLMIPFEDVEVRRTPEKPPLPGISGGNSYVWRERLPVWHAERCECEPGCMLEGMCPDGVITFHRPGERHNGDGPVSQSPRVYLVDYEFCKGCGICANMCPYHALTMEGAKHVYGGAAHSMAASEEQNRGTSIPRQ